METFWTGFFALLGPLAVIYLTNRTKLKLERLKLYESEILKANLSLYDFVFYAYGCLWPPENPRSEFIQLIKSNNFKSVKKNILYYDEEVRNIIKKLESQYECLSNDDFIPEKPFLEFYKDDLNNLLQKNQSIVEKKTDSILHK